MKTADVMKETNVKEVRRKSAEDKLSGKAIKRRYWLIAAGVTVVFSGYSCVLALQSSIHIENGLGSKLTTISYATQTGLNFLLVPFILRLIGAKKSMILSEFAYIFYVVANAFSNNVILVIGAVAAGMAEAFFWCFSGISFVYFANKYHPYSSRTKEACVIEFSGTFYFMYQLNPVFGNIVSTLVLQVLNAGKNSSEESSNQQNTDNSTFSQTYTTSSDKSYLNSPDFTQATNWPILNHVDYCGANDCQDINIIDDTIDNYVPTNKTSIYVLSGIFVLFMLLGVISHIILIPEMLLSDFNETKTSKRPRSRSMENKFGSQTRSFQKVLFLSLKSVKDTLKKFFHPYQLFFVTPYTTYLGFNVGFVYSEVTRAYGACLLGVNQVGICVGIFAFSSAINNFLISRFYRRQGLVPLLVIELIYDLSLDLFLLLWRPTEATYWITYGIFVLLGFSSSFIQIIAANIYGGDFYKNKEISFTLWSIVYGIGFTLQFGISTLVCVRDKIYIGMTWIFVGVVLQIIFETRLKKGTNKRETKNEEQNEKCMIDEA